MRGAVLLLFQYYRVSTVNSSSTKSGSMLVYSKYIIISCIIAMLNLSFVQIQSESNSPIKSFITRSTSLQDHCHTMTAAPSQVLAQC